MPVTIEVYGQQAAIELRKWTSPDGRLQRLLQDMADGDYPPWRLGYDPDPDLTIARDAARQLGGRVTAAPPVSRLPGTLY